MRRLRDVASSIRAEGGQTLTEFAIIAPVIVGIFVFAIYFYETTQIKLKQQEAERYVLWEFTGKLLTDYGKDGNQTELYTQAKSDIIDDTMDRFDDLRSINKGAGRRDYVMTSWTIRRPSIMNNEKPPEVPGGGIFNFVFQLFKALWTIYDMQSYTTVNAYNYMLMAGSENATRPRWAGAGAISQEFGPTNWGFNNRGYIQVKMEWDVAPTAAFTKDFMDRRFKMGFRPFGTKRLNDRHAPNGLAMVIDSWNLQDGRTINGGRGNDHDTAYWKQVNKMAFVTPASKGIAQTFGNVFKEMLSAVAMMCMQPPLSTDPTETALTSKPYGPDDYKSGQRSVQTDTGSYNFDTAPYTGGYSKAFDARGQYFMGCKGDQKLGCTSTLGQNNPFGDYIITGE